MELEDMIRSARSAGGQVVTLSLHEAEQLVARLKAETRRRQDAENALGEVMAPYCNWPPVGPPVAGSFETA